MYDREDEDDAKYPQQGNLPKGALSEAGSF